MPETKRERALRLALNCGVIHEKAVDDWYEFKEADLIRLISLARAEAFEEAADALDNDATAIIYQSMGRYRITLRDALRAKAKEERYAE